MPDSDLSPSIAQMYDLGELDPWDRRSEAQKRRDIIKAKLHQAMEAVADEVLAFVDPPDNESFHISDDRQRYYRITVLDQKLSNLVAIASDLPAIMIMAANRATGCWVALNSQRVARKILATLQMHGLSSELAVVDSQGAVMEKSNLSEDDIEAVLKALGRDD